MTWNSSCSIASDDENSRHSFLSDCDSEFDLRPPPRYPAEKRTYPTLNKQSVNRIEPPLTRSRAKAMKTPVNISEPLPKQRRQSGLRRSFDTFTEMATTLTNSLNNNSILFPKQESSTSSTDRVLNSPLDGVNILADRFESCSLDEGKLSKNCLWPSRETNSHYTRPINSLPLTNTFGATPFSTLNNTTLFAQSSTSSIFGHQQAQLWSRFRFAASSLRDNLWSEQTDLTLQQVPSNIFTSNQHNSFHFTDQSSMLIPPQTVPIRSTTFPNKTLSSPSLIEQSSASLWQRKNAPTTDSIPCTIIKEEVNSRQTSISKLLFTFTIFIIGLTLGYFLTNTLPPNLVWQICMKYFHYLYLCLQTILRYFTLAN
ncbi:unnamed protein product [Adineta steineri]|uniref:Uncharacterized protein n=1 Tax=Adineta steineri TaxID=433720 RepID=A0A818PTC4_9BILA|nr:unnamed protein product [Adineta steineri]